MDDGPEEDGLVMREDDSETHLVEQDQTNFVSARDAVQPDKEPMTEEITDTKEMDSILSSIWLDTVEECEDEDNEEKEGTHKGLDSPIQWLPSQGTAKRRKSIFTRSEPLFSFHSQTPSNNSENFVIPPRLTCRHFFEKRKKSLNRSEDSEGGIDVRVLDDASEEPVVEETPDSLPFQPMTRPSFENVDEKDGEDDDNIVVSDDSSKAEEPIEGEDQPDVAVGDNDLDLASSGEEFPDSLPFHSFDKPTTLPCNRLDLASSGEEFPDSLPFHLIDKPMTLPCNSSGEEFPDSLPFQPIDKPTTLACNQLDLASSGEEFPDSLPFHPIDKPMTLPCLSPSSNDSFENIEEDDSIVVFEDSSHDDGPVGEEDEPDNVVFSNHGNPEQVSELSSLVVEPIMGLMRHTGGWRSARLARKPRVSYLGMC